MKLFVYALKLYLLMTFSMSFQRFYFGINFNSCLLVSCIFTLIASSAIKWIPSKTIFTHSMITALLFAYLIHWNIPNLGNGDSGFHARYLHQFIEGNGQVYKGASAFYASSSILYAFGINLLDSFIISHVISAFLTLLFSISFINKFNNNIFNSTLLSCALLPIIAQWIIQGAHAQAYSLFVFPLALLIISKTDINPIFSHLLSLLLVRHSYLISLRDLIVASGIWFIARRNLFIGLILIGVGAYVTFPILELLFRKSSRTDIYVFFIFFSILSASHFFYNHHKFLSIYLSSTAIIWVIQVSLGYPILYFGQKALVFPIIGSLLVACSISPLRALIVLIPLVIGIQPWIFDFIKVSSSSNYSLVKRIDFLALNEFVTDTQGDYKFGGILTSSWPRSHFLNGAFQGPASLRNFRKGVVKSREGFCVVFPSDGENTKVYLHRMEKYKEFIAPVIQSLENDYLNSSYVTGKIKASSGHWRYVCYPEQSPLASLR